MHETNGKRQRREQDFVFSRQAVPQTENKQPSSGTTHEVTRPIKPLKKPSTHVSQAATNGVGRPEQAQTAAQLLQVRRFHISRSSSPSDLLRSSSGIRKRTANSKPTVFVERTVRHKLKNSSDPLPLTPEPTPSDTHVQGEVLKDETREQTRPQKKPGLAARRSATPLNSQTPSPIPKPRLPSSFVNRSDADLERLALEMQAYTLQSIGAEIATSEAASSQETTSPRKQRSTRFKPRKPALRYKERHPDQVNEDNHSLEVDEEEPVDDYEESEGEDSEYIIETYYRVPADVLESAEGSRNIGLLVLESQPDIDEFYINESDSEEEDEEDEEDENG